MAGHRHHRRRGRAWRSAPPPGVGGTRASRRRTRDRSSWSPSTACRTATSRCTATPTSTMPSIDALAADGVTFTRAYAHTPQVLPGYTTLLTGRLPFEHGVRDDGGFVLRPEVRTLAELLRNRGFATGGAVSTYPAAQRDRRGAGLLVLRRPVSRSRDAAVERAGDATAKTALAWLGFAGQASASSCSSRPRGRTPTSWWPASWRRLKERDIYDSATIFAGRRPGLHPGGRGPRRRVAARGLRREAAARRVRRPACGRAGAAGRRGPDHSRSGARADARRAARPLAASRARRRRRHRAVPARSTQSRWPAYYRLGAAPAFALTTETRRLVREATDTIVPMPAIEDTPVQTEGPVPETVPLGAVLDELVAGSLPTRPEPLSVERREPAGARRVPGRAGAAPGSAHR